MKEENKNITKKQHIIPKFYLRKFVGQDNNIQRLDLKNNQLCSPRSCSGIAYSNFFYAAKTGIPDEISQLIEKWLQRLEDIIAKKIPDIENKILENKHIDDNDRYILSVFMCMLWLRSSNTREWINQAQENLNKQVMKFYAYRMVDNFAKENEPDMSEKERTELIKIIETGSYNMNFDNIEHLKFMTETLGFNGPGFSNMFFGHKWKIYIAKGEKRFVTSDSPVFEWWPPPKTFYGGASFLDRNKYFALTPEIFIELTYPCGTNKIKRKTIFEKEDNIVSAFNLLIAFRSHGFVYSGNKEFLEDIFNGRNNPGEIEIDYYIRFEKPWEEYKNAKKI